MNPDRERTTATLERMTRSLTHRGPDDQGMDVLPFGRSWLGLGQRRLAIMDLSPLGHNPMFEPRSGNVITFNGEIYNFAELKKPLEQEGLTFRSSGDTEVLLKALTHWGIERTVSQLAGMYAFAFFEPKLNRLTLVRDPLGIKPLYAASTKSAGLAFASEVRAILQTGDVEDAMDRRGLAGLLAYGSLQHPFTLFAGIQSLDPGVIHTWVMSDSGLQRQSPKTFWHFPSLRNTVSAEEALRETKEITTLAVREHLISDVPVGVFLSAGLDSTIIAGLAARFSPRIRGFTVGFSDHADLSEMELAAETARHLGLTHVPINLPSDAALAATDDWLAAIDQPSIDGLNTYVISRAVRKEGIVVALSGLGADELFGGYGTFRDVPRAVRTLRAIRKVPSALRRGVTSLLTLPASKIVRRKMIDLAGGSGELPSVYFQRRRLMSDGQLHDFRIDPQSLGLSRDVQDRSLLTSDIGSDPFRAVSELESRFYQGNTLLRDSDVMGMAHGLEIRVPFLDRRLLDYGHSLPGSIRAPGGVYGKQMLRQMFPEFLRPALQQRSKTGFTLPLSRWMRGPLRETCQSSLQACIELAGLPEQAVRTTWQEFEREPETAQWTRSLVLVVLGDYLRRRRSAA